MLEHRLQKEILYKLVTSPCARFAELKPPDVDGNIFTYHLKQLIAQKLVIKDNDGNYCLTSMGKAVGINIQLTAKQLLEQAHSIFLIVLRDKNGRWLLRRRLAHPMYGAWGFVHGEPEANETLEDSANKALFERTGLKASFKPLGTGYIKIFKDEALESYTHFLLIEGSNIKGKLLDKSGNGENKWVENPDFSAKDMIPSMNDLVSLIDSSKNIFFEELEYRL